MLEFINKGALSIRLFLIFVLISFSGCSNTEIGNPEASSLFSLKNDAELETYIHTQYLSDFSYEQTGSAAEIVKNPMQPDESSDAAFENDIISVSDGSFIYETDGNRIIVSRNENNDKPAEKIAAIETFGKIIKLLINQNIIIAIQTNTGSANLTGFNSNIQTGVLFIDVSNPYIPERLKEIQIDGRFIDNILKNGKLYIIQQFKAEIDLQPNDLQPDDLQPDDLQTDNRNSEENQEEIKKQIESYSIDRFIPNYAYMDDLGQPLGFSRLVNPEDLFRPAVPSGSSMTIVTLLNVKDMFILPQSTGFIGNVETISSNSTSVFLNESTGNVYEINITGDKPVFTDFANAI